MTRKRNDDDWILRTFAHISTALFLLGAVLAEVERLIGTVQHLIGAVMR